MNCSEFKYPILSVSLLTNGTDILYHVPSTAHGKDVVPLVSNSTDISSTGAYAVIKPNASNGYGTPLIADLDSAKITSSDSYKTPGCLQKVSLEYTCPSNIASTQDIKTQINNLRTHSFSLLIEFFDGTYGLVRNMSNGDGYLFSSKEENGTTTNTITIYNITGLQLVSSITPHA